MRFDLSEPGAIYDLWSIVVLATASVVFVWALWRGAMTYGRKDKP